MDKCGYLNKDNTCNCIKLCDVVDCIAIKSNYKNVKEKYTHQVEYGISILKEIEKRGYND